MPRGKSNPKTSGSGKRTSKQDFKPKFNGFVDYRVPAEARKAFEQMLADGNDPINELPTVLAEYHKLGLSYDSANDAFIATLYGNDTRSTNAGYVLSQRASEPYHAIRKLLYVHVFLLQGDWSVAEQEPTDLDW